MYKTSIFFFCAALLSLFSCEKKASQTLNLDRKDTASLVVLMPTDTTSTDSSNNNLPKNLDLPIQQPIQQGKVAVKENLTLVGVVVQSVEIIDSLNYKFTVRVQTAIPETNPENIIELDQIVTVYPAFQLDENKKVNLKNPVNQKLFDMRQLKKGGVFMGRIKLANDMKWYIVDVEFFQNASGEEHEF
jgi:hypothetical protein